jgi:hypothetical protein
MMRYRTQQKGIEMEFVTIGGHSVTKEWADAQTSTAEDAAHALQIAEENVARGYFPAGHANEAAFIRAKYPSI